MNIFSVEELKQVDYATAERRIEEAINDVAFLFHQLQACEKIELLGFSVGEIMRANAIGLLRGSWKSTK